MQSYYKPYSQCATSFYAEQYEAKFQQNISKHAMILHSKLKSIMRADIKLRPKQPLTTLSGKKVT